MKVLPHGGPAYIAVIYKPMGKSSKTCIVKFMIEKNHYITHIYGMHGFVYIPHVEKFLSTLKHV